MSPKPMDPSAVPMVLEADRLKKTDPGKALDLLSEAEKFDPDHPVILGIKIQCLIRTKNPYTAHAVAVRNLELQGDQIAYSLLALALKAVGKLEAAEETICKAYFMDKNEKSFSVYFWILIEQKKFSEARKLAMEAISCMGKADAYWCLGESYFIEGRLAEAERHIRKSLKHGGDIKRSLDSLSRIFLARGKNKEFEILQTKRGECDFGSPGVLQEIINLSRGE